MRQMVAEELDVPIERITELIEGDTALCPDQGGTGGSTGISRGGQELRRAAATARQAILALGAQRLGRPVADLETADGVVRPKGGGPGRHVRRADRGPPGRPQDRREGAAQALERLPLHRPVRAATGRSREGHGPAPLRPGSRAPRNAPRARDPAPGARRDTPVGRRVVDRGHPGRSGRPDRQLPRRRRRARVGRGARGAAPQGPVVGGHRPSRPPDAGRRGARDADRAGPGRREAGRSVGARRPWPRRADARRDVLVAGPDPRLPRAVVRRGGRPSRRRHDLDVVPGDPPLPRGVRQDPESPAGRRCG